MPLLQTRGSASVRGFGTYNQAATPVFIEDCFSTFLYTGNGGSQTINNGIPLASTAEWWAAKLLQNNSYGFGITTDSSGNVYVTGYANDGTDYIVVAKYNTSGTLQWQRKLLQNGSYGYGITTDSSGNVYVTGYANDGTNNYIVVAKYNTGGTLQWQRKLKQNDSYGYDITTDSSGNVYVTGNAYDGTNWYIVVAKYNTSGTLQWQRKLQQNNSVGRGITTDSSGNVYVTGYANDGTNNYIVVAKYNTSGTLQWQRKLKQNNSVGYGITTDSSGNVYVTGNANDGTNNYIVVAKYNTSGTLQWQRKLLQNNSDGRGITTDSSGNVYVTGQANDGTRNYIVVAKYNTSGTIQWQRKLQQNGSYGYGITTDSSGNVYVTGYAYDGTRDYIVVAKLAQDGSTVSGTAFVTMTEGTATDSAGTATDSAGTATDSAGTATDSAGTATDSAGTATSTTSTQAAVVGKGGLVWLKGREGTYPNYFFDTARGANNAIWSDSTNATGLVSGVTSFSSGFTLGSDYRCNDSTAAYDSFASWTFAEQAKFFDVVTYTGNGASQNIAHSLGSVPGCIIVKATSFASNWMVYHNSLANTEALFLNLTNAKATGSSAWNSTTPTSTVFSVGANSNVNASGETYVAYLFAHNAGGFGLSGTENVISCGSFTTDGSGNATVTLNYEPQFVITKRTDSNAAGADWCMWDTMRGMSLATNGDQVLYANTSAAESVANGMNPTATGFGYTFGPASASFIYIAIRRGPMRVPTSGTSVFAPIARTGTGAAATVTGVGFPVDFVMAKERTVVGLGAVFDRLRGAGPMLGQQVTDAEISTTDALIGFDTQDGFRLGTDSTYGRINTNGRSLINYALRRAPQFFDEVCFTGDGTGNQRAHNLTVAPELLIQKSRGIAGDWGVTYPLIASTATMSWNLQNAETTIVDFSGTATTFKPRFDVTSTTYVCWLAASCPGVSKVGSFTGTGNTLQINCGFTTGARFVLIKRRDSAGDWYLWDSARGIVAGNDPYLLINSQAAEVTTTDWVDTLSTGFELSNAGGNNVNINTATYLFWAIA